MLAELPAGERMRLMRFLCAVAWLDGEVQQTERDLVKGLVQTLDLSPEQAATVEGWLAVAPPDGVPPLEHVPPEHRKLFFDQAVAVAAADGKLTPEERDRVAQLLHELL